LRALAKAILNHRSKRSSLVRLREEHAMLTLSLLVADRYGAPIPDRPEGRQEQMVASALAWFEQHMEQNPGVCDVARALGISPQHLRRLFRKVTGMSVKRRLLLCQIQRARQLLSRGEDKIAYIARLVGFRSHSAFSRAFSRIEGHPPQACRPVEHDKEAG
jgi:transcriptional regulator GlxA family with amidase domain